MWEWVHAHHDDLQALGPVATLLASVFAAGAAIFIGLRLQGLQASIAASQIDVAKAAKEVAESQRDIAMDKLKIDLFNKRYALYAEARDIAYDSVAYFDGRKSAVTTDRLNKL